MSRGSLDVHVQRRRRRRPRAERYPEQLYIAEFRFAKEGVNTRYATVLVRGRMGQVDAMDPAYDEARRRGREPSLTDISTVPAPRPMPALDALARRCTAFPTMLALLTAAAGYRPSIRLDLQGREGLLLARAYDRQQARWGDTRRAFVTGELPRRPRMLPAPSGVD